MTRKQALHKALEALTDRAVIEKVREIAEDLPLTGWSERRIFDAVDQFVLDHGRNPTATDFIPRGMPPHTVIKLRFGLTLGEFLEAYYPQPEKDKDEYKKLFISEYERFKPKSAGEFNKKRAEGVPTWGTFAGLFGFRNWLEWLAFCGLDKSSPTPRKHAVRPELTVLGYNDLTTALEALSPE